MFRIEKKERRSTDYVMLSSMGFVTGGRLSEC